ncbi:transcriptional repressor LexA [soil metagenome]
MPSLTHRQQQILDFVREHQERHGRTPSGPEIARRFGFTHPSSAYQHLRQIEAKGFLQLEQTGKNRLLRITLADAAKRPLTLSWPRLGGIPAGPLMPAASDDVEQIRSLQDLVPDLRQGDYLLTVEGDSMIGAGLEDGMTAVLRPGRPERPGAVCAVWIDGEGGTLKRVFDHGDTIELVPENPAYKSNTYPADQVRIQGVLVSALMVRAIR